MLTKNDLNQISELLDTKFDVELKPIKKDIKSLKKNVGSLKTDVDSLAKDVKVLKRDVSRVKKDQRTMLDLLDKEQMQQRKRIIRLEEHAGLPIPQ